MPPTHFLYQIIKRRSGLCQSYGNRHENLCCTLLADKPPVVVVAGNHNNQYVTLKYRFGRTRRSDSPGNGGDKRTRDTQAPVHGTKLSVFPSPRKQVVLSDMVWTAFLRKVEAPSDSKERVATAHSFRSSFRD